MSVPLDRLYNFLHDICNRDDLIIYRFFPHGSRKIEDLKLLNYCGNIVLPEVSMILHDKNFLFCHDQEPLNFDFYQSAGATIKLPIIPGLNEDIINKFVDIEKRIRPEMNLRLAVGMSLWRFPIILSHSEKRSVELTKYENIKFIGLYWWCHALIARDWFRYAEHDVNLRQRYAGKDFLIYNRAWSGTREYRLKFTELLVDNNIHKHCMTWFNPLENGNSYSKHHFVNPTLQINNLRLEDYFEFTNAGSMASADYCLADYQRTKIEVVLETLFDDCRWHLTEKILRPIACGHPFMLAGTHQSLEYLKSYGFKTFHPWINETYDGIQNPLERLQAIVHEMKRIVNLDSQEKNLLYLKLDSIAHHNKQLFFSNKWQDDIVNEFLTNFKQAVENIKLLSLEGE